MELIEEFNSSVLCLSLNIPGQNKLNKDAKVIFDVAIDEISKLELKVLKSKICKRASGYEALMAVDEDALKLKKRVVQIEESRPLGRFMDIDVIDCDKRHISRSDISLSQRVCFVCGDNAKLCARSAKHPLDELLTYIHKRVDKFEKN